MHRRTMPPQLNGFMIENRGLKPQYRATEVKWETMGALEQGMSSPPSVEAQRKVVEDLEYEAPFVDFSQPQVFVTEEPQNF